MTIDILTIFPEMFDSVLNTSILGRAREKGLITIETTDIRPFSVMKHKNTDDYPFGGGAGMLMTPQPIADAIKAVCMKRGVPCIDRMTDSDENIAFVDNGELIADREINMNAMPDKAYDVKQYSDTDHEADEAAENGNVLKEYDMYSVGDSLLNDRVSLNVADATEIYNESDQYHKREDSRNAGIFDAVRPINSLMAEHLTVSAENIADKAGIDAAKADQQDDLFAAGKNETVAGVEKKVKRIYLSPRGVPFTQRLAEELAKEDELILLCGHYEGVDQRVLDKYIDMEISVGDYVLTGGELGAMIIADCVARLLPGVLGSEESPQDESFSVSGLLEYPQYTRPRVFEGMEVPEVLLNGDHAKIAAWRREQAILETKKRRPELLQHADLTDKEKRKYLIDMGNYQ